MEPENPIFLNNRGGVYLDLSDHEKALADLSSAIEIDPNDADAHYNKALLFQQLEVWSAAITSYSKVIEIDPRYKLAYFWRAMVRHQQGKFVDAISDFTHEIQHNPEDPFVYLMRGRAHLELGHHAHAFNDFQRAIDLDSEYAAPYLFRSEVHKVEGNIEAAIADIERFRQLNPNFKEFAEKFSLEEHQEFTTLLANERVRLAIGLLAAATAQESGDPIQLRKWLNFVNRYIDPDDPYSMAMLLSLEGNVEEALDKLTAAVHMPNFDYDDAKANPALQEVRKAPRFSDIVKPTT